MTTKSSIPASTVDQPRRALLWIPRSGTAWAILILGAIFAAVPAFYAAGLAFLGHLCFDTCDTPAEIAEWVVVAVVFALSPLVVVRIYQGEHPASARGRLAIAVGLVVALAALAWYAWAGNWPS